MATADPIPQITPPSSRSGSGGSRVLVFLSAMSAEQQETIISNLTNSFSAKNLLIATPNEVTSASASTIRIVSSPVANAGWLLTASDFANAYQLAKANDIHAIIMLGPESHSLRATVACGLGEAILSSSTDLTIPCYELPPNSGLVNSAILYPLTRALFASRVRFPLAIDLGLSLRLAERLASSATKFTESDQDDALIWPVNEAITAGLIIEELDAGPRDIPQPADTSISTILPRVTSSLFADIEAKAAYWQRPRRLQAGRRIIADVALPDGYSEIPPRMIEAFQLAYTNLQDIWSLVLPPNSLLNLKRLSVMDVTAFRMPDNLWARIVFDFLIAYRLRTINRGHLFGALIPLYLAWVASHINVIVSGTSPESHVEALASAFEAEKPYLVSRWRWPDRFNS